MRSLQTPGRPAPAGRAASPPNGAARKTAVHVVQGEQYVTHDEDAVLSTILGSCVAACLWDPIERIGGMNHFLLPGSMEASDSTVRMGVHAMELLINEMLASGAARRRLQAKVFGGANINPALGNIGSANAAFARDFLQREGIPIVADCLGGVLGRRVQFWPVEGRARRSFLAATDRLVADLPVVTTTPTSTGALELF